MQLHFTKKLAKHLNQNYCKDTEPFYVKRSFFSDNIAYIINPILNPQLERYQQRTTTLCVPGPPPPDLAHAQCKIYTIFYMEQHQRCVCCESVLLPLQPNYGIGYLAHTAIPPPHYTQHNTHTSGAIPCRRWCKFYIAHAQDLGGGPGSHRGWWCAATTPYFFKSEFSC